MNKKMTTIILSSILLACSANVFANRADSSTASPSAANRINLQVDVGGGSQPATFSNFNLKSVNTANNITQYVFPGSQTTLYPNHSTQYGRYFIYAFNQGQSHYSGNITFSVDVTMAGMTKTIAIPAMVFKNGVIASHTASGFVKLNDSNACQWSLGKASITAGYYSLDNLVISCMGI